MSTETPQIVPSIPPVGPARPPAAESRAPSPVRERLGLQQRAPENLRRHVVRSARRFTVLVIADLASFWVMRVLLRSVRDVAVLGEWVAGQLAAVLPKGILNGWQFAAAILVALLVTGNYGQGDKRKDPSRLFLGCALATALPLWMTIWTRGLDMVMAQYALTTVLVWLGLLAERMTVDRIVSVVTLPERHAARTLLVGPAESCRLTARSPAFSEVGARPGPDDYLVLGFVDVAAPPAGDALGAIGDFTRLLQATGAESVVVCGHLNDEHFHTVVDAALAAGCQLLAVPRAIAVAAVQPVLVTRRGALLMELTRPTLQGRQLFLKRTLDVVAAGVGLVVLAPVFAAVAIAVRLDSPGPLLFGHVRLGLNGSRFRCYKFRSMHSDAEARLRADAALYAEYVAHNFKLPEARDPRLTRVGRWLRKTSLDELPQLLNVLRGQMSLVGPRPIVPEELEQYGHGAPVFLSLKPGITGAWQVNGRSAVGYPDRADMELEYVRSWSLARDLWILFKTVPAVMARRGAH